MVTSEVVAPHLPFLRRYARALTGSQASGDAYVRACLEALIARPFGEPRLPPRVALYRLFHVIWSSTVRETAEGSEDLSEAERTAQQRLSRLVPEQRQALLLTALEGFVAEEVAQILGKSAKEISSLVAVAMDDIKREVTTDVLIIEDEPIIALDLSSIVADLGHRVTKVATTAAEALDAARQYPPGLVLADIQLADGSSGLDAVNEILESFDVPVIFITAYPERLLTGSRPEPTFLVNKPFRTETVQAVISQALFFDYKAHRPDAKVASA